MFVQSIGSKLIKPAVTAAVEPLAKATQVAVTEGAEVFVKNAGTHLAEQTLDNVALHQGQQAATSSRNWGIARSVLAIAAGVLLMFFLGPRAIKLAAKGVQMLAGKLLNPSFMSNLAQKGMLLYGAAETVLPTAKNVLSRMNLPPILQSSLQAGERLGQSFPELIQPGLNLLKEPSKLVSKLRQMNLPPALIQLVEQFEPHILKLFKSGSDVANKVVQQIPPSPRPA